MIVHYYCIMKSNMGEIVCTVRETTEEVWD